MRGPRLAELRLRTAARRGWVRRRRVRQTALPPFPQPGVVSDAFATAVSERRWPAERTGP